MKRGKKILPFVLALSLGCSLCGCKDSVGDDPADDSANTTPGVTSGAPGNSDDGRIHATYTVQTGSGTDASSEISDILYGIFFEDINFSVDAGLYAEMIKNRSFEYGSMAANANRHGWVNNSSDTLTFDIVDGSLSSLSTDAPLNTANPTYARLTNTSDAYGGIGNVGYLDGLAVTKGADYVVTLYIRARDGYTAPVRIALEDSKGTVYAESTIDSISTDWWKYEVTLTPNTSADKNLRLVVEIMKGSIDIDMISMMPKDTYKGIPIRKDIGEALEALNPSFIRFPGGCAVEGRDEESMYSWKDSIGNAQEFVINGETTVGDVAVRPQGKDIWNGDKTNPYYTTYGIGFYEYFLLCDALDALPIPILNAGMTCPIQSSNYKVYPMDSDEFKQCVQDALDLVEFCLGDKTTEWGAVRIAMGHEAPFNLKYVGIGNEQWQSEYFAHYQYFVDAFKDAAEERPEIYGDIELIVANGPVSTDTYGWDYVNDYEDELTTLVDEHFYEVADWFFKNTNRYDSYDRTCQASVFLGEYAAKANTMKAALAEAAFMTGLERNADIVTMACYAPLFGNSSSNQWTPDMIFFSNDSLMLTPNYYVQKLFASNVGTNILDATLEATVPASDSILSGKIGLASWMTSVSYDNLKVVSNVDGSVLYENDFSSDTTLMDDGWQKHRGNWSVKDGALVQSNTGSPADTNTGDAIYVGDTSWTDYTMTVDATILSGAEGFLIPICVKGTDNNIFWNVGGWGNTVSCLQIVEDGAKSDQVSGTVRNVVLRKNSVYNLRVEVTENNIKCYINNSLYVNYTVPVISPLYETTSIDANGDIIMKFVNPTEYTADISVTLADIDMTQYNTTAVVTTLAGDSFGAQNSFSNPDKVASTESTTTIAESFSYEAPAYSVTIIRVPHK